MSRGGNKAGVGRGKVGSPNSVNPIDTQKEVVKDAPIGHDTYSKAKYIIEHGTEEQKEKLLIRKKGYRVTR